MSLLENTAWNARIPEAAGLRAPLELRVFMTRSLDDQREALIYYDASNNRTEVVFPRREIRLAQERAFQTSGLGVKRSTGGYISAIPMSLVLYTSLKDASFSELRVRVRFRDFQSQLGKVLTRGRYVEMTKDVLPSELIGNFELSTERKYIVELGQGGIPIQILGFDETLEGEPIAICVNPMELKSLHGADKNQMNLRIQRYFVPTYALRLAPDFDEQGNPLPDFFRALENYERLRKLDFPIFPKSLHFGTSVLIPGGSSVEDCLSLLRQAPREDTTLNGGDQIFNHMSGL